MTKQQPIELFMPPNVLKAKAGGGSGPAVLDSALIKRAEQAMETLKTEFDDWIGQDVAALGEAYDGFVREKSPAAAGALFRASHDIRGQAATFDYPLMARVATSLCRLIEESPQGAALPPSLIDAHVAAIRVIHRDKIKDPNNALATTLAAELEARTDEALKSPG